MPYSGEHVLLNTLAKYRPLRDAAEFFHPICLALVSEQLTLLQTEGKHVKVGVIVSLA